MIRNWKSRLENYHPVNLFPSIIKDGYTQVGQIVWNPQANRIEIFPNNGGWFGIYEDGHWEYDAAPFAG